jgi:hypothetical protein
MSRCSWSESINKDLRYDWPLIVQAVGLDASATLYLFRHSNIARMLLSGAYTKLIGDWHNTSEKMTSSIAAMIPRGASGRSQRTGTKQRG